MDAEMNRKLSAVSPEEVETDTVKQEYGERMKKENGFENFKGNDPKIRHIRELGQRIARTDFPVLITGETGTGKEVIARAIHMESGRSEEPFVAINCGAIPAELLESELFGYEGGSFTGAKRQGKIGKFEMANKGTFFLDEIGDMPLYMQVKLLRVLQEHEIERVGGSGPIPIDVRILSATRMNLMEMVQAGTFREDLYYRLAVVNIQTVALRACPEDIILHALDYLDELNRQYKTHVDLSDGARRCLKAHSWPGNVRELENVMQKAVLFSKNGWIQVDLHREREHVFFGSDSAVGEQELWSDPQRPLVLTPQSTKAQQPRSTEVKLPQSAETQLPLRTEFRTLEEMERAYIEEVLAHCGGKISGKGGAAEILGMKRTTLISRMEKLGIRKMPAGSALE